MNVNFIESGLYYYALLYLQCQMQVGDNRMAFNTNLLNEWIDARVNEWMTKWMDKPFTVRGLFLQ